jgi:hypothetical protein
MTNVLPLSSRIYCRLLVLYPEDLRRDYGADMALVFADDLDAARRETGTRGVIHVWRCALGEFLRFGLAGCVASTTVRVPVISFVLFSAMLSGEMIVATRHAPDARTLFHALRAALLLPLFSTPFVSLLSVWACRGSVVHSLGLSGHTGEDR